MLGASVIIPNGQKFLNFYKPLKRPFFVFKNVIMTKALTVILGKMNGRDLAFGRALAIPGQVLLFF